MAADASLTESSHQLMQDSLGGNAKTLMFVNISPADYNEEESVVRRSALGTSEQGVTTRLQTAMQYAQRVKLITNDANKNADNEEVTKLKRIIADLKAGRNPDEGESKS